MCPVVRSGRTSPLDPAGRPLDSRGHGQSPAKRPVDSDACAPERIVARRQRGGDREHRDAIAQVADSIERISAHKSRMISDQRVFYGSKSDYQSKLSTFLAKCERDINFPDINQKLDVLNSEQDKKNKVSCSDIERNGNDSEKCFQAGKDLLRYGFADSSSKFPAAYSKPYGDGERTMNKAKELLKVVKSKELCN
jgi:hypothetical protein